MVELVGPQVERTNLERANILRWEDDGGQAIEYRHPAVYSKPGDQRQQSTNDTTAEREIGIITLPSRVE